MIVNQLDMGDCNVEFRGSDSERLQNYISTAKPGPIITLTEYTVGADGKGRKKKIRKHKKQQKDGIYKTSAETVVIHNFLILFYHYFEIVYSYSWCIQNSSYGTYIEI